jgi:nitrite reductase/ring-hydroxylating ferredoxin subunit
VEVKIASTKDLPNGKMIGVEHEGKSILVANWNGNYYAIGNVCTHEGCTVSGGTLSGFKVRCPCHGSTFDIRTGTVIAGPAQEAEPSYRLKVAGDQILLVL